MFYSTNILTKKGPLGTIWIAAHHDVAKKLTKLQILSTDIVETAGQIENPEQEMALRLSSHLLVGLSRIYTRKVQFLFTDCNEALSKITLAFRPSNVDLHPVSTKAQIKAITLDDPGISGLDLDLDLNLTDADWMGTEVNVSQMSAADITLPDVVTHESEGGSRWEEEDPLFFGGAMEAGDNPLDVNYDAELEPEAGRAEEEVEDVEMRRDSDGSALAQPDEGLEMDPTLDGPAELPDDIQIEPPKARPSEAVGSEPPLTPLNATGMSDMNMEFDTPGVEVKRQKLAGKKKGRAHKLEHSTEIPKDIVRGWIMNQDSTADIMRAPNPLPKNRREMARARTAELMSKGRGVEAIVHEPLTGYLGPRLRQFMIEMTSEKVEKEQEKVRSRKRKAGDEGPELEVQDEDREMEPDFPDIDPEQPEPEVEEVTQEADEPRQSGGVGAGLDSVFGEYAGEEDEDDREEAEVDEQGNNKIPEHFERTKKVIVMLQKNFKGKGQTPAPLQFKKMIRPTEESLKPSKHTAAVAFFELLGLQAKGFVHLNQPDAYGDIAIAPKELLMKQKIKI